MQNLLGQPGRNFGGFQREKNQAVEVAQLVYFLGINRMVSRPARLESGKEFVRTVFSKNLQKEEQVFEYSKATERKLQKDLLSEHSNDTMAICLSHPTKKRIFTPRNSENSWMHQKTTKASSRDS